MATQCSCLENPRDGEAWWAAVYGVAQSQTRLKRLSSSSSSSSSHICSYNKIPQTRWLTNRRHILFTVLETASPRSGYQHGHILGRTFFHVADYQLLKYLHMVGVGEGVIQTSFIRLLSQFMKFLPHHLIQFSSVQSLSCVLLFATP